jgi:MFS family permease
VAQPLTGALVARRGSAPATILGAILCALLVVPPAVAGSLALLVVACLALGFANGMLDVAMNVQGVTVERSLARPILSRLHALFSLGMLAAGALAAAIATETALVGVGVAALVVTAIAAPGLQRGDAVSGPAFARPSRALATLSAIAFAALLCEGAVADWSAVHLHETLGTSKPNAALGLTAFALAMTVARLLGDRVSPPPSLAGVVAGTGLITAALAPTPLIAITGFAAAGIGLATLFPVVIRKAGDGPSIAAVSTAGYVGLVTGPPLVGALAEATSLKTALAVILGALSLSIVALAR